MVPGRRALRYRAWAELRTQVGRGQAGRLGTELPGMAEAAGPLCAAEGNSEGWR